MVFISCNTNSYKEKPSKDNNTVTVPKSVDKYYEPKQQKIIPPILKYEGNATDEMGNTAYYKLNVKSDFSSASIAGVPYSQLEPLANGIYQWDEGSLTGIKIRPSNNNCILYNVEGSYFCTLQREN